VFSPTKSSHIMGLSASKRVQNTLQESPELNSACAAVFADCLSLSQHAFSGVRAYQLFSAAERLHSLLSDSLPLISKWVPSPLDRTQVDRALKTVLSRRPVQEEEITLDEAEFKEFAVEVFADAVVSNAEMEVLKRVPLGVAGIAGFGLVVKPGKGVVVAAIGAYALGVVTSIYLGLDA
ncbi:transmembrane protein, partial [Perilla frutescens var. frutescens]